MSKTAMIRYSLLIPFTPTNATQWHPRSDLELCVRGSHRSIEQAREWAQVNIPGHAYSIKRFDLLNVAESVIPNAS